MRNQQVSLEQRKPQRLFSLREVHNKQLVMEVVCPTIVGEDIVCTLSKGKGSIRPSKCSDLLKHNSIQHCYS